MELSTIVYSVNDALVERKRELHRRRRAWPGFVFVFVCLTFMFVVLCRESFALNELVRDLGGLAPYAPEGMPENVGGLTVLLVLAP